MKIVHCDTNLQQLHTSDKQVMDEEHLLHETNHCDVTVKSESIEFRDIFSMNFITKETKPTNYNSTSKINEKIPLKYEIKHEQTDSLYLTECTDDTAQTFSKGVGSESVCEDSKINIKLNDGTYNIGEEESFKSVNKINYQIPLKFELKDESTDDNSLNRTECADETVETLSTGGGREIVCEDSKVNIKLDESTYTIGEEKSFKSMNEINYEIPLKLEIKDEPTDDHSLFPTECVEVPLDTSYKCGDSENSKVYNDHTPRSNDAKLSKSAEWEKDISANDKKYKIARENKYQCDVCNKCFSQSSNLIIHKRIHTGEKPYPCDVCDKCFTVSSDLLKHKRTHTGEKPYKCDFCNKCFNQLSHLYPHIRTHTGEKPYQCDVCNKRFIVSSDLLKHKRAHAGDKPYQCDICNKSFSQSSNLNLHKRTHTGEKPYQCDVCNKCFGHSSTLILHKRTHTGEKPYPCDVCNKWFTVLNDLIKHKRTHTGEKPYQCEVCKKCFSRSDNLNLHKRTHTGEKPYQCDVCNKSFTLSSNLISHKRTHTGEKPYTCDVCNKCFSVSGNLIVHKRTHTGEKSYQ